VTCCDAYVGFACVGVTWWGLSWHVGIIYFRARVTRREAYVGVPCWGLPWHVDMTGFLARVTRAGAYVGFTCVCRYLLGLALAISARIVCISRSSSDTMRRASSCVCV